MRTIRILIGALLLASLGLSGAAAAAEKDFTEGVEYHAIEPAQPTSDPARIEVVEMFYYGCPHCYRLEPELEKWVAKLPDDVVFVRTPAVFNPRWELMARAYYAAELLDIVDKVHGPIFDAIHKDKKRFDTEDDVVAFVAGLGAADEQAFRDTMRSFGVAARVNRARDLSRRYGIKGVPSLIVDGKYRTSASDAGSNKAMLLVVEELIEEERARRRQAGGGS